MGCLEHISPFLILFWCFRRGAGGGYGGRRPARSDGVQLVQDDGSGTTRGWGMLHGEEKRQVIASIHHVDLPFIIQDGTLGMYLKLGMSHSMSEAASAST